MTLTESLKDGAKVLGFLAFLGATMAPFALAKEHLNPYNMKTMPQAQPFVFLYDKDNNGGADSAMEGWRGGDMGAIIVVSNRAPTEEEKEWYRTH